MREWPIIKKLPFLLILAGILVLSVCCVEDFTWGDFFGSLFGPKKAPPDYLDYLEQVKAQSFEFQIPASEDAKAWARAHDLLKFYGRKTAWCSRKLRVSTDDVLEIDPKKDFISQYEGLGFLYRIIRVPQGNRTTYTVSYASHSREYSKNYPTAKAHAQILAYYIVSGKLYKRAILDDQLR